MAYQITSFSTSPFTNARIYSILCDTDADLPATIDGYSVSQGWTAKTVDGKAYIADSSGTWVLQQTGISLDLDGYYTSAETDTLLAGKQDALSASQMNAVNSGATSSFVTTTTAVLPKLVNDGAKNIMHITLSSGAHSASGITYTVNDAQTEVTATNTATSTSYIILQTLQIKAGTYVVSGCPSGGGDATYKIRLGDADNANAYITQDIGDTQEFTLTRDYNMYVMIYIFPAAGSVNLTFKPMICSAAEWEVSNQYVSYGMTNAELTASLPDIVDIGAKNMIKFYATAAAGGGTATINPNGYSVTLSGSSSVTGMKMADIVGLENVTYIFKYDTTGTTGSALVIYDNTSSSNFKIVSPGSGEVEINNFNPSHNYSLNNYVGTAASLDGTVSAMLCKKSLYTISSKYTPYRTTIYDAYNA